MQERKKLHTGLREQSEAKSIKRKGAKGESIVFGKIGRAGLTGETADDVIANRPHDFIVSGCIGDEAICAKDVLHS